MDTYRTHTHISIREYIYIFYAQVEHFWLHARYKVSLNKFSGIVLVSITFSDHNEIKLEIINKKINRKTLYFKKLNTLLTTHGLR